MPAPSDHIHQRRTLLSAERAMARIHDAEHARLDLPPVAVQAVAPAASSPEMRQLLADYILGAVHRAGLSAAFRALFVNDAVESRDPQLCRLAGAVLLSEPSNQGPSAQRWAPPAGVPETQLTEGLARDLARLLLARETARQEEGAHE
jgi:hypothetical protein